jgi:hypothetical protein
VGKENPDGVWRPENTVLGWVATKWVDFGPPAGIQPVEDGQRHGMSFYPRAFDTMAQCEKRCAELNDS